MHTTSKQQRSPQEITIDLEARDTRWEYAPGKSVDAWGFQGTVPGPTIVARAGDTLVARVVNRLTEGTVVHWHGVRLPAAMDGTEHVQSAIKPGETFEYRFTLPDPGTYWYHSHANETVQVERGLYGAIVVHGDDEPTFDADRVLVLDDLKLDRKGRIAKTGFMERHDGREGKVTLINGRHLPEMTIAAGHVERWRMVNACNARYVKLSLGGRPFRIIGGDNGLRAQPVTVTDVLITPGQRLELAVGPFTDEGAEIAIESLPYSRGMGNKPRYSRWGTLRVGARAESRATIGAVPPAVSPLVPPGPVTPMREIRFEGKTSWRIVDWTINGKTHLHDKPCRVGELQIWEVNNTTGMDHPFHLHGFFFQVIAIDGVRVTPQTWDDTVNVPAKRRVTIAWVPDDRPGMWMYHCHILEHHAAGMMAHFKVVR